MICYTVEYRTMGGSCHSWSGTAIDEDDAVSNAIEESYVSMCNDDHFHSVVNVWEEGIADV